MAKEDLIPLSKRSPEEVKAITSKPRIKKDLKKRLPHIAAQSKYARCLRCKADCVYKEDRLKENINSICCCPDLRAYSIAYKIPIGNLNESWINGNLEELLEMFRYQYERSKERYEQNPTGKELRNMFLFASNLWAKMMELKRTLFPAPQRIESVGVNVNVEGDMAERVLRRIMKPKEEEKENGKE